MGLTEDLILNYKISKEEVLKIITECNNPLYCIKCADLKSYLKKYKL